MSNCETLSAEERQVLPPLAELDAVLAERHLDEFVSQAWPLVEPGTKYVPGWHIDAICAHLEAIVTGAMTRLIINIPPRHMKSLAVSLFWPTWVWLRNPSLRFLYSSYAEALSVRDALKSRRLMQTSWYQKTLATVASMQGREPWAFTGDQNQKSRYENDYMGHRVATGVDGSNTGEGGDIIVVDDPHNVREVNSERRLQSVHDWWDQVMQTRLNDPATGAIVVIMQRVHEKDLTGHILAKEAGYTHLCLPAEYEGPRSRSTVVFRGEPFRDQRTEEGELLWPDRFGPVEVASLKRGMGTYAVAGQFQQRPAPREGGFFKRRWFELAGADPEIAMERLRFWDQAATKNVAKKMDPDYTAGVRLSKTPDGIVYIEDIRRLREGPQAVERETRYWADMDGPGCQIWIEQEPGSAGKNNISFYQRYVLPGYGVRGLRATGPKESYADPFAAYAEAGNVRMKRGEWNEAFLSQLENFPLGAHDDMVDAVSKGFHVLMLGKHTTARARMV